MARTLKRANPKTIQDKFLVGYQGWFTCAGDGEPIGPGHHGWLHWFNSPIPTGGRPNTDLWPDVSEYDASELYPAPGLSTSSGDPVHLFSSRHPKTVRRHFHWMALHGVDGAFLQRFAGQCEIKPGNLGIRDLRDEIGDRVREAAEAEGRVFAIMYDVSGVAPDKIQNILEQDWVHLLREKHLLDSPNYLREKDRPVVALWGFGLNGRNHTPELVRAITDFFRSSTPGGVYLVAGAPGHWRTSSSDADRNPGFLQVWTECFDAISPWTVGRYGNEEEADRWGEERVKADAEYLKRLSEQGGRRVDYMPVVLPGGSGFNLSEGKWGMNDIRRNGGQFLWRQIYNARRAGVRIIYGAMWDEYDEGTAFMPVVSRSAQLPVHPSYRFIALDADGHELPPDWYMRIVGFAAEALHGERTLPDTFPVKELQNYWSTRPRYEEMGVDEVTKAFRAWDVGQGDVSSEAPPPYSLEDSPAQLEMQEQWLREQEVRVQQQQQQQQTHAQVVATNAAGPPSGGRPLLRQDTRPSLSSAATAARVAAAATGAAMAYAMSSGSGSSTRPTPSSLVPGPPPVDMSSRPAPPTSTSARLYHPTEAIVMAPSPHLPHRPSSSHMHASYDVGRPHTGAHTPTHGHGYGHSPEPSGGYPQRTHSGHASSLGHGRPAGMAFPAAPGVEHGRGRSRSRSRSRGRSRSRSRSRRRSGSRKHAMHARRSHSRSSSGSRKHALSPVGYGQAGYRPGHGLPHQSHQQVHSPPPPSPHPSLPHGHGHEHAHSLSPVGSHVPFPGVGAPAGMYHAQSEGGVPLHSNPIGHGTAYGHGSGGYEGGGHYSGQQPQGYYGPGSAGYAQGQGYAQGPAGYGQGQGYAQGQGYGQGYEYGQPQAYPQQAGPGYVPHPSMASGYYNPYMAAPAGYPGGMGRGGIQGGITSALQTVEGIAGRQTRQQLEKTVKSLANSGSTLFNKLK